MSFADVVSSMILPVASTLALDVQSSVPSGGLERVVELARSGAFPQALGVAEAQATPAARAQAKLYVLHHAGDLTGALAAGREGLTVEPRDLWLLERVCYISLSLRALELASEYVDRLARAVDTAEIPDGERTSWRNLLAEYRAQATALEASSRERIGAARRARWTVWVGLAATLVLLGVVVLPCGRPPLTGKR